MEETDSPRNNPTLWLAPFQLLNPVVLPPGATDPLDGIIHPHAEGTLTGTRGGAPSRTDPDLELVP